MHQFNAEIAIIGINPFVFVPEEILTDLFKSTGKHKGKIPIFGSVNGVPYKQTLVKYSGDWRLYINTTMLKNSPKRIGETITLTIAIDTSDRSIKPHPKLIDALTANKEAKTVFESLPPSRQHEIVRYIAHLKTEQSIDKNIARIIGFLTGNARFAGRDNVVNLNYSNTYLLCQKKYHRICDCDMLYTYLRGLINQLKDKRCKRQCRCICFIACNASNTHRNGNGKDI